MKILLYSFCFCLFCHGVICAGWNEDFDEESYVLGKHLDCLHTKTYEDFYGTFTQLRKMLLKDASLRRQLAAATSQQRIIFLKPREGLVVKKRASNRLHDFFSWELANLFGVDDYVVPSFPVEIAGKKVIIQKMEPFTFGQGKMQMPSSFIIKKIHLVTYWKAHFAAYLIGLGDLVGKNIGVSSEGVIRFFDLEYSLHYCNKPARTNRSFKTGFSPQSLEWPQYRYRLDQKSAENLREYVHSLDGVEEKLKLYLEGRKLPFEFDMEGFLQRLQNIRLFALEEGKSFRDFYAFLYPKLSPGLDFLTRIAESIFHQKVGHGSALVLICRRLEKQNVSSEDGKELEKWIHTYVDSDE
jgi:hypothetical protein